MEVNAQQRMSRALGYPVEDPRQIPVLNLAYVGDTVYDLYVRAYLIHTHPETVHNLHLLSARMVCAQGQARAFFAMEKQLTEEEVSIYRRGRNAHSGTVPKNANVADYRVATGLETLLGHLWVLGREERIDQLMAIAVQVNENAGKEA